MASRMRVQAPSCSCVHHFGLFVCMTGVLLWDRHCSACATAFGGDPARERAAPLSRWATPVAIGATITPGNRGRGTDEPVSDARAREGRPRPRAPTGSGTRRDGGG